MKIYFQLSIEVLSVVWAQLTARGIGCDCSAVGNVVTVRLNNVNVSIICCRIMIAQS